MNVSEKVLTDSLIQLLEVVESVERFVDWESAGEARKDDFDIAVQEARESLGAPNCEGKVCARR